MDKYSVVMWQLTMWGENKVRYLAYILYKNMLSIFKDSTTKNKIKVLSEKNTNCEKMVIM